MIDERKVAAALEQIGNSYVSARNKHAPMRGPHEGYAVLLEEVDELWAEVKRWQPQSSPTHDYGTHQKAMKKEALHVAAMALAFLVEVCGDDGTKHATTSPGPINCNVRKFHQGSLHPRTCERCGLGPCPFFNEDGSAKG